MPIKDCSTLAVMTFMILGLSFPVPGSSGDWQPFIVRGDLAPVKSVRKTMRLNAGAFEHGATDSNDSGGALKLRDEGSESRWSQFQFGGVRLRISRYQDHRSKSDAVGSPNGADGIWATVKTLPGRFGNGPSRETFETMGKIFTPHLDLGIEF